MKAIDLVEFPTVLPHHDGWLHGHPRLLAISRICFNSKSVLVMSQFSPHQTSHSVGLRCYPSHDTPKTKRSANIQLGNPFFLRGS